MSPPPQNIRSTPCGRKVIAGIVLLVLLGGILQGTRGIWRPDEGRYTCVAMQMLRTGDWIHPHLNPDVPHLTKPPLTYWAIASSIALFGRNETAARLPNTLADLLTALLVAAIAQVLVPGRGWLAALVWLTMALPRVGANIASTDMLLTLFESLAMLGFVRYRFSQRDQRRRPWLILMWAAFGLAFLTKGPPGLLPLLGVLCFTLWQDGTRAILRLWSVWGLLAFLVLSGGWFAVLFLEQPDLAGSLFQHEVIDRIFSGRHRRNAEWYGAFLTYVPALIGGTLPWTWGLLRGARSAGSVFRSGSRPELKLLAAWMLVPLAVFFLARSRLPLYLLPLFVPLSVVVVLSLRDPGSLVASRKLWLLLWLALLVCIKLVVAEWPVNRDARALSQAITQGSQVLPAEVVFIRAQPNYGLSIYLDCEVSEATLDNPSYPEQEGERSLRRKLRRPLSARVFVMPDRASAAFLEEAALTGTDMIRVGGHGDYQFYTPR